MVRYLLKLSRPRYQVQNLNKLNYAAEANKLAQLIKQYDMNEDTLFIN
jgi:replication factor A1